MHSKNTRFVVLGKILDVLSIASAWRKTSYGITRAMVALVDDHNKGRFTTDLELISLKTVVDIDPKAKIDVTRFCEQHNIYFDGSAPLAKAGIAFLRGIGFGADEQLVMDLVASTGFTSPSTVLPTVQILRQLGIKVETTKGKSRRGRRRKSASRTFIMVKESRRSVLNKIANIGNTTNTVIRPTKLISFPLYTLAPKVKQAGEVATGDFYGTIERVFVGNRLINVGVTSRRPHAKIGRSKPFPYNVETPYTSQTVRQAINGVAMASDFGLDDVYGLTTAVEYDTHGVTTMVKSIGRCWVEMNKDVSNAANEGYMILQSNKDTPEVGAQFESAITVADDDFAADPVRELVLAGPSVIDTQDSYGLPQATWSPTTN